MTAPPNIRPVSPSRATGGRLTAPEGAQAPRAERSPLSGGLEGGLPPNGGDSEALGGGSLPRRPYLEDLGSEGRSGSSASGRRRYHRTSSLITVPRSLPANAVAAPKSLQSSSLIRTERCLVFGAEGMGSRYGRVRTPATARSSCGVRTPADRVYVHLGLGAQRTIQRKGLRRVTNRELPENDWRRTVYGRSVISGTSTRKAPRLADRIRVQQAQGNRCLYCELPIATQIWRRSGTVILRTNWDHFVPYSYLARNPGMNWVLACHVCNGIKSCRMFDSIQAARAAILPVREAKGYEDPKDVLLRFGLAPAENPWPDRVRIKGGARYHVARLITAEVYLTACGIELPVADSRDIARHQGMRRPCAMRRDIPVVPPSVTAPTQRGET